MPLVYYIYISLQKITQLYQQLPESRLVGQKSSTNQAHHFRADLHPQQHEHHHNHRRHHYQARLDSGHNETQYHESHFDKNEMYQLQRVLAALRQGNQIKHGTGQPKPGNYYSLEGEFTLQEHDAPDGYVWLQSAKTRLLCHRKSFPAFEETWVCSNALPLAGIALALCSEESCGLPLVLWLKI